MSKENLRIMFMNAENLFLPGRNFHGAQYTQEEYTHKIDWISSMITRCQVHICAFSEIGVNPADILADIQEAVSYKDTSGWPAFAHTFSASPGICTQIRVAVISRFNLSDDESIDTFPKDFGINLLTPGTNAHLGDSWIQVPSDRFSCPVGKVTVNPPDSANSFHLFVVHLKSKRPITAAHDNHCQAIGIARSAIQRNVEAAALRFYLDSFLPTQYFTNPDIPTIIMGTFNDSPSSVPLENICGSIEKNAELAHPWSEQDIKRLISCAKLHMRKEAREDELFTYVHNDHFALLDQAFITEHLPARFKSLEVYHEHVFRHQETSTATCVAQRWKSTVSDHGVIVIELEKMLNP